MYLKSAIFKNVSPFGDLKMSFDQDQLIIFSGINGRGKTTILSYVADAFFEIARVAKFTDVFEDSTKYYRVTSLSNILDNAAYSFAYLRFVSNDKNIDYIEVVGQIKPEEYEQICVMEDKINFSKFENTLKSNGSCKFVDTNLDTAKEIFQKNIITYFPFDRSEVPVWMNEIEYKKYRLDAKTRFSNQLNKNIECRVISEQVANWMLDVVLDFKNSMVVNNQQPMIQDSYSLHIYNSLNEILRNVLIEKSNTCRLGIGQRKTGYGRISIVEDRTDDIKSVSPSIFHLSSGEICLFILFAEIIRQYDIYCFKNDFNLSDIAGIVIIDEVDKHLHIKLQKEVLPKLITLFPNLQFIVSSHSPFFALGVSELLKTRARFLDLSVGGRDVPVTEIDELESLYQHILSGNENYKKLYNELESNTAKMKQLIILTEGYNIKYILKAVELFAPELKDKIYICKGVEGKSGCNQLMQFYEILSASAAYSKTLFVWDCDVLNKTHVLVETDRVFKFTFAQNNNNIRITKGIENLFNESLFEQKYYLQKESKTSLGEIHQIQTFDKKSFCEAMCSNSSKKSFELFEPLIIKIKSIVDMK